MTKAHLRRDGLHYGIRKPGRGVIDEARGKGGKGIDNWEIKETACGRSIAEGQAL